jgi:hypothetical protein
MKIDRQILMYSTTVNQNLSVVLAMSMYKRNKLQLCIHLMHFVVIQLNMNDHPHNQYNCASVFVELTSTTVLTKLISLYCVCSETVLLEMGLRKSFTPKCRTLFKEWHLINWWLYCSLCYKNTTLFSCNHFQISTENSDVCYNHLPNSISLWYTKHSYHHHSEM